MTLIGSGMCPEHHQSEHLISCTGLRNQVDWCSIIFCAACLH
jgi:hypothetical protein